MVNGIKNFILNAYFHKQKCIAIMINVVLAATCLFTAKNVSALHTKLQGVQILSVYVLSSTLSHLCVFQSFKTQMYALKPFVFS